MHVPGLTGVAATLLFYSSACGGAEAPRPVTHRVTIEGAAFTPATLIAKTGDTITWINKDPYPHTVTSTAGRFDSGAIQPDASWQLMPAQHGQLAYTCVLHPTMKGTLRVE